MKNLYKNHKGITLIALIITIIVLLILAGVTIAAITGNESAPNKAVEARQKNEQGAEFDAIKVAAVSSVVEGKLDLNVDIDTLKANLQGLVTDDLNRAIDPDLTEWTVTGNSGIKYLITNKGMVTLVSTVDIARNGETVTETTISLTEEDIGNTIQLSAQPTADLTVNSTSWQSSNTSMATIDNTGTVSLLTTGTTTITLTAQTSGGNFEKTCIISITHPLEVGDSVSYITTHNNVTLDNWKVFHKYTDESTGENYTWIIYGDCLPYEAIGVGTGEGQISGLAQGNKNTEGNYCVKGTNRTNLLNAMTITSNWSSLLTETKNGQTINHADATDANIKAMGSPILELWRDSWNAKYPNTSTYTSNQLYITSNATGYLVSRTNETPKSSEYSVSMSGSQGYVSSSNADELYFPHTAQWRSCNGYWLASPSASSTDRVMYVLFNGYVSGNDYYINPCAFRPVVCLPSSVFE